MANHVYFNVEIDANKEAIEQLEKVMVQEKISYASGYEGLELIEIDKLPFMQLGQEYESDGYLKDSYDWYCENVGAKWCNVEEVGETYFTGYSAWSPPVYLVENLTKYLTQYDSEISVRMTYEDEFRNFIGTCHFYFDEEVHYDICEADNSDLIDELREVFGDAVDESDFDWYDLQKDLKGVEREPQEVFDDIVYAWFERN